jgi:hypothetical protein
MESREQMKRRMDAVLALKNSITANRVGTVVPQCPPHPGGHGPCFLRAPVKG